jgi:hypothetical protein
MLFTRRNVVNMDGLLEVLVIIGMFILRLGVPLLVTVALGYLLRRLDTRWEAEAQAEAKTRRKMEVAQQQPCWVEKGCSPEHYTRCPGYRFSHLPCWLARLRAQNQLPAGCPDCTRFSSERAGLKAPL